MTVRSSILLALRFLGIGARRSASNARRSLFGAIAGIGISLVPLVIVLVVSDGMIEGITARMVELSTAHLRVVDFSGIAGVSGDCGAMEALAAEIPGLVPGGAILGSTAERQGLGIAIGKKGRSGATVRAVQPEFFSDNPAATALLEVSSGKAVFEGESEAIIGKKLAADIGVSVGDTFRVLTTRNGPGGTMIPRFSSFRVQAIVSSGYQELDALWVFIPFRAGCRILDPALSDTFVSVRTADPFGRIDPVRNALSRSLPDGLSVFTWKEMNRSQYQSFNTTRILLLFIMALILLVASVNVSSALVMLVMERRREIAILKSCGASPEGVTTAFLLAGFLTGLGGIACGFPVGIFCSIHINGLFSLIERALNACRNFLYALSGGAGAQGGTVRLLDPAYYLETIPVHLRPAELCLIAAGTLVLSVLVSILPAVRAGREKPLDTLRKY